MVFIGLASKHDGLGIIIWYKMEIGPDKDESDNNNKRLAVENFINLQESSLLKVK